MKTFVTGTYPLLESTVAHYFRTSQESQDWHKPTWKALREILDTSFSKMDLMPILRGPFFLTLHIFFIYKMEQITNIGDKITFLQDVCQLVEGCKTK